MSGVNIYSYIADYENIAKIIFKRTLSKDSESKTFKP